jgi:hypothetical protein
MSEENGGHGGQTSQNFKTGREEESVQIEADLMQNYEAVSPIIPVQEIRLLH